MLSLIDKPDIAQQDPSAIIGGYTGSASKPPDMPPLQSMIPISEVCIFLAQTTESLLKVPARTSSWFFGDNGPLARIIKL